MKIIKSTYDADKLLELFGCFFNKTVEEILKPDIGAKDKVDAISGLINNTADQLYDILGAYHFWR